MNLKWSNQLLLFPEPAFMDEYQVENTIFLTESSQNTLILATSSGSSYNLRKEETRRMYAVCLDITTQTPNSSECRIALLPLNHHRYYTVLVFSSEWAWERRLGTENSIWISTCLKACRRATERALDPATMPCEYWRPSRTIAGCITVEGMLQTIKHIQHLTYRFEHGDSKLRFLGANWINQGKKKLQMSLPELLC